MAHVPVAGCVKVCMNFLQNGQETCNIYYVDVGGDPNPSQLNAVADVFTNWAEETLRSEMNSGTSIVSVEVTDAQEENGEGIISTTGLPLAGTKAGGPLPNNVSLASKLVTGFTGRSRRGRKFFAGLSAADVTADAQEVNENYRQGIQNAYNQLLDDITDAGFTWVIASLVTGGAPRVTALITPVVSVITDKFLDSMRKRLNPAG